MLEEIKQTFEDIKGAIQEMGVDVDYCDSPRSYASKIRSIQGGGNTLAFIPVFKSSIEKPAKPTQNITASDPTAYPEGWSTPDGLTDNIWMSYTLVGNSFTYIPWTEPVAVGGNSSSEGGGSTYGNTRSFLIYLELSSLNLNPSKPVGGIWNYSTNKLVGDITSTLSNGNTVTWSTDNNHVEGMYTYLSMGTFDSNGNIIGDWSDPFCINSVRSGKDGKDGRNGTDGTNVEFIYKRCRDKGEFDELVAPYSNPDVTDYIPDGWTDQPQGIDDTIYRIEAVCTRKVVTATNKWGAYTAPVIWAIWGGDGTDGDGIEYVFRIATDNEVITPDNSSDGKYHLIATAWPPISEEDLISVAREHDNQLNVSELLAAFQENEFISGNAAQQYGWDRNWTDDPLDVSSSQPYEFCSIRKEQNGVWQYFSEPVLWNIWRYADVSSFTAFAFTRSSENLSTDVPQGGTKADPVPTSTEKQDHTLRAITWYDSIPSGTADVWVTTRLFGDENLENQGWTSPRKLTDTVSFQVEYSNDYPWSTKPTLPSLNNYTDNSPEGINESAWRTYCANNDLGTWSDTGDDAIYMATCRKANNIWTDWTVSKIKGEKGIDGTNGTNGVGMLTVVYYFKAFNQSTGVTPPDSTVDPTTVGWTIASSTINLSSVTPYLWAFTRTTLSDGSVIQSDAYIVRYFNDQANVDYNEIVAEVSQQIESDLSDLEDRLSDVEGTYAVQNIDTENGLIELITNYKDANQKSFADIIADSARAQINANVGAAMGTTLTSVGTRLSAVEGTLTNAVTTEDLNGAITDARQEISDTITTTVGNGRWCWVSDTDGSIVEYNGESEKTGYHKEAFLTEMSAIKQDSHKVELLVGEDGHWATGIQILSNCATNNQGSKIILDANRVEVNGQLATTIITAASAEVNNLIANNATIGTLQTNIANISNAMIDTADVNNLIANHADITTLKADMANIGSIVADAIDATTITADKINTGTSSGINTQIENGVVEIKNGNTTRARFGISNGDVVLEFLDSSGNVLYNLGPSGFNHV